MALKESDSVLCCLPLLCCWLSSASCLLSPNGVNFEGKSTPPPPLSLSESACKLYIVQALISIKGGLVDPNGVLDNWDKYAVDPCSWAMVTCSADSLVTGLGSPSQNLSGRLSPCIGNLTNLQSVLLQDNNITGPLPYELGRLSHLHALDLSTNSFTGEIPTSLANMQSLQYLRLNKNSLTGAIPSSLANMAQLAFLDLSFNNLSSSPLQRLLAKTYSIEGNPQICTPGTQLNCTETKPMLPDSQNMKTHKRYRTVLAVGLSLVCVCLSFLGISVCWRRRHRHQAFLDETEQWHKEAYLGNLRKFQFRELQTATSNFSSKNIIGKGGFGVVYKGYLHDGTAIAIKRLNEANPVGRETQFQTEVGMIHLAVHRNLLRLYGFCSESIERLLVYPFMPNGSVAFRLKAKPALDWSTRKRIALGAARGLLYLHEQCHPKIIHRDVKAANILLDECCEAVVGDFGLAKLLDHEDSHVTTEVMGTVGHIAPEYLSTGKSSEKTDVFGFGILLLELITGQQAMEFGKTANQKEAMLDWVKKLQREKKLKMLVDKDLGDNYDRIELEEIVQVAVLCTQLLPSHRPKMAEIVPMLEGDGLAEKWEAPQRGEATKCKANELSSQRHSDLTDDSLLLVQAMELSGPR